jgi:hypothetical protein
MNSEKYIGRDVHLIASDPWLGMALVQLETTTLKDLRRALRDS